MKNPDLEIYGSPWGDISEEELQALLELRRLGVSILGLTDAIVMLAEARKAAEADPEPDIYEHLRGTSFKMGKYDGKHPDGWGNWY